MSPCRFLSVEVILYHILVQLVEAIYQEFDFLFFFKMFLSAPDISLFYQSIDSTNRLVIKKNDPQKCLGH